MALQFYAELLRTDPSYDERWYFHRDLGLIRYNLTQYQDAARHYDLACHLKNNDSELFRFAGDAYYYRGCWAEALIRYEKAVEIESIERYFLDAKIDFARCIIRKGVERDRRFQRKRDTSHWLSRIAVSAAESGRARIALTLFSIAKGICDINFDADNWLALYANRKRSYREAIAHLKVALAAIPEDPSARLNLVVNLIFQNDGQLVEEAHGHAEIAIFHGGPETRDRFRLRLTNTENRDKLCEQFEEIFNIVKRKREEWMERRREILKPEMFGRVMHFEFHQ
jgi:tetratricopeptide (TPR) repeat protein